MNGFIRSVGQVDENSGTVHGLHDFAPDLGEATVPTWPGGAVGEVTALVVGKDVGAQSESRILLHENRRVLETPWILQRKYDCDLSSRMGLTHLRSGCRQRQVATVTLDQSGDEVEALQRSVGILRAGYPAGVEQLGAYAPLAPAGNVGAAFGPATDVVGVEIPGAHSAIDEMRDQVVMAVDQRRVAKNRLHYRLWGWRC
jgi:hypothetical protein